MAFEALAEVILSSELPGKGVYWDFDNTDGVVGYTASGLATSSGSSCIKFISTGAYLTLATAPSVVNPPFIVQLDGSIKCAPVNWSDANTLEIYMAILDKRTNSSSSAGLYTGNPNLSAPSSDCIAISNYGGNARLYVKEGGGWIGLASYGTDLVNWWETVVRVRVVNFDGTNYTYSWVFEVYQINLNADRTLASRVLKYSASGERVTRRKLWGNSEIKYGGGYDGRIDYIRIYQGVGVSGI